MGWEGKDAATISCSEVIELVAGNRREPRSQQAAKIGNENHDRIIGALKLQMTPTLPGFFEPVHSPIMISEGLMMKPTILDVPVNERLMLRVKPDGIVESAAGLTCIEVKSNTSDLSLLQLTYGCMAAQITYGGGLGEPNQTVGAMVTYGSNQDAVQMLSRGGEPIWDEAKRIVELAAELQYSQRRDEADKRFVPTTLWSGPGVPVVKQAERATMLRWEMDSVMETVAAGLLELLK